MENTINDVLALLNQMNSTILSKLETIESRLARLEKMDSIEHRVSVNQIDLSDIKEILERIEENKLRTVNQETEIQTSSDTVTKINKRLDTQLLRIAKVEEELELLRKNKY